MKLLTNSVGTYATGDAVADAVLRYALALARAQELDVVDVPFVADGEHARVQITIGWMVVLDAISIGRLDTDFTDAAFIADLQHRENGLHAHGNTPLTAAEMVGTDTLGDY